MNFYTEMQQVAKDLIKEFSQGTVIYNHPGGEATPFDPAPADTPYPVDAVQAPEGRKKTYIEGGYIVSTDILLAVSPFGVEPVQAGTVSINGEVYQIKMVDSPTVLETTGQLLWFIGCGK